MRSFALLVLVAALLAIGPLSKAKAAEGLITTGAKARFSRSTNVPSPDQSIPPSESSEAWVDDDEAGVEDDLWSETSGRPQRAIQHPKSVPSPFEGRFASLPPRSSLRLRC